MAKKKRQKIERKSDDVPFKFPEFDKDKFLEDEFRTAKTVFIASGLGLAWGITAAVITAMNPVVWAILFVLGLLMGSIMRLLFPLVKVDMEVLGWKGFAGSYAVYFFTMVAVWIVMINPPFADLQKPVVLDVEMEYQFVNETGKPVNESWFGVERSDRHFDRVVRPANVKIMAQVADNDAVDRDEVHFELLHDNEVLIPSQQMDYVGDYWFEIVLKVHDPLEWSYSQYEFKIFAMDVNGRTTAWEGSLIFRAWE